MTSKILGISEPADYNWSLMDLDGQPYRLRSSRAKSCSSTSGQPGADRVWVKCPRSPSWPAPTRGFKNKNIEFLCVSTDASAFAVRHFLADKNWTMTILRAERVPAVFSTEGIPATFLIGPDGRIAASKVGAADWNEPGVVSFLEKLASPRAALR